MSGARFAAGLLGLAISLCASAALVAKHLHLFQAPGCGAGSACDQAADSLFGSLPLVGWPLSHFGLAWFTALLVTWVACFRGAAVSSLFRTIVRIGSVGSLVYIGAMLAGGYLCPYCLAVHVGMFAFMFIEAGAPRTSAPPMAFAGRGAIAFMLVTGALVGAEAWQERRAEQERQQSTQEIIEAVASTPALEAEPFIGRYPRGPERAPIRIVSFIDYACGSCKKIEEQAERILATRDDVMLSVKHFPLCADCNDYVPSRVHPNACRAAAAAETAGLLGGSEAFWALTRWLFEHGGTFTDAELLAYIDQAGWDAEVFFATLESEQPKQLVKADTQEADRLGIFGTPVVYINGVELKGFQGDEGLVRAVEDLAAAGLPALDASADQPVLGIERNVAAWRSTPRTDVRPRRNAWSIGPMDASEENTELIEIVLFADYLLPATAAADALVRELVARRTDVRYSFRHFPLNTGCNPVSKRTINDSSCSAHFAAETSGRLYGEGGYWSMHDWILAHQEGFDLAALDVAAAEFGWDVDDFWQVFDDQAITQAIASDCREAARVNSFASPSILIAGRAVPNWKQPGILDLLVDEALYNPPTAAEAVDPHAGHAHSSPAPTMKSSESYLASHPSAGTGLILSGNLQSTGQSFATDPAEGYVVGPASAPAKLVLWGDLQSTETAYADRKLQELFGRRSDVSYQFRHFPVDGSCNPNVESTRNHDACQASRVLEAAGKAGGIVGYWRMFSWLMSHQRGLDQNALLDAAASTDLIAKDFLAWLDHPTVQLALDTDLAEASELGLSDAPTVFLNDEPVPNWKVAGEIERRIEEIEK